MELMQQIQQLLEENFAGADISLTDLTGTGDHIGINITSEQFRGRTLLQQHQMVMDVLRPKFASNLHAVQIKTRAKN